MTANEVSERVFKKSKPNCDQTDEARTSTGDGVQEVTYVEFYAGVGGWTMALDSVLKRSIQSSSSRITAGSGGLETVKLRRLAAFDHSDLCTRVFQHNFSEKDSSVNDKKAISTSAIEKITKRQVEAWQATLWAMSPPCQPHTRQHGNQQVDLNDPRSKSFLHLLTLLEQMEESSLPRVLVLENVIGFESSASFQRFQSVLQERSYHILTFHLTPTQVHLPNDRPRCFCLGLRKDYLIPSSAPSSPRSLQRYLPAVGPGSPSSEIFKDIPELDVNLESTEASTGTDDSLPTIGKFLDTNLSQDDAAKLKVPDKVLKSQASWCFDIVTPGSRRSSCFTHSYGRYNRGTGSILYEGSNENENKESRTEPFPILTIQDPKDRSFDPEWAKNLDLSKFRYFSGMEMARLMGFSEMFSFPSDYTYKQQWKLIGNSLNVPLASKIVELGFRLVGITPKVDGDTCAS